MEREERRNLRRVNGGNRFWSGLLLLAAGGLLMARQLGADIPGWLFQWYMILIAIGLLISFKSGFKNAGGLIMIVAGVAFLLNDIIPNAHMQDFIFPGVLMIAGIIFILRPRQQTANKRGWQKWDTHEYNPPVQTSITPDNQTDENPEFIQINSVFGGVKKIIFSKNFKGGEINAFMGGAEINLLQADIKQNVLLEINNVFGGTKLILPSNWDVKNEVTAVFGGVEDKRSTNLAIPDPNKAIILKGACVFGGIEIKNF
jgi:predicted membrane protein